MPELARSASRPISIATADASVRVRRAIEEIVACADRARLDEESARSVYDIAVGLVLQVLLLLRADESGRRARLAKARAELRSSLATSNTRVERVLGALDDLIADEIGNVGRELSFATKPAWLDLDSLRNALEQLLGIAGAAQADNGISAEQTGHLYEEMLQMHVQRLEGASVCIKPNGFWIVATDVLAQSPELRSKWLQRTCGMSKSAVQKLGDALRRARCEDDVVQALSPYRFKETKVVPGGHWVLQASTGRRQSGSHYTPSALASAVVEKTLGPLVSDCATSNDLLALRICDPAMGSGIFLTQTCEFISKHLRVAWQRENVTPRGEDDSKTVRDARRAVTEHCLFGVDRNVTAVRLARLALSLLTDAVDEPLQALPERLVAGDALVGFGMHDGARTPNELEDRVREEHRRLSELGLLAITDPVHWPVVFREVFGRNTPGFDAFVGNPPWVAYAGRAAQPLDQRLAEYYKDTNPAFGRYRSLQGLFVWRAASLLRRGGRLGFVLPTSVADLDGYGPTRRAHDVLCAVDAELLDFGDGAFAGVFQPSMALTSTRRNEERREAVAMTTWSLARNDLDTVAARLLARLSAEPTLDARLFGERGFQTTGNDLAHLRRLPAARAPYTQPLREGSDIGEYLARPPTLFAHPEPLVGRFRDAADWRRVRLLIRQTARYPLAALSDGLPFRNSILAAFSDERWSEFALLCYLNCTLVRWFHYFCHRDARQGMPQLKIGHLRHLPDLPAAHEATRRDLDSLGRVIGPRNEGLLPIDRRLIDELVFDAHGLDTAERKCVLDWARRTPPPKPRDALAVDRAPASDAAKPRSTSVRAR